MLLILVAAMVRGYTGALILTLSMLRLNMKTAKQLMHDTAEK